MASKHLLALAYASGQHDGLLAIDPESFLQRWGSMIDMRALMPAETGAAATNAYNTAVALATTEAPAARLAIRCSRHRAECSVWLERRETCRR